ncbi:hypothetical protein ACWFR1_06765 [Streptomyces sp. NPDC055103]
MTVIAALGGGAVVNNQFAEPDLFAAYGIGLFFGYFVAGLLVDRSERKAKERLRAEVPRADGGRSPRAGGGVRHRAAFVRVAGEE